MKYPGGLALNDLCSWLSMQPATFQSSRVLLLFQEWHRFKMWQAQCAQLLLVNFGCDEQWLSSAYLWPQRCVRKQCHSVPLCHSWYLLVGGLEHEFYFPIYWVANHPNWLIFFRGVAQPPTSINTSTVRRFSQNILLCISWTVRVRELKVKNDRVASLLNPKRCWLLTVPWSIWGFPYPWGYPTTAGL